MFDPLDGPCLHRSILENPDDDATRLIYSDWVEERGCPGDFDLASFIRVQCRLARVPWTSQDMIREHHLWEMVREAYRASLGPTWTIHSTEVRPSVEEDSIPSAIIKRGFVAEIRLPCAAFVGGVCERCQGRTWWHREGRDDDPRDVGGPMDCEDCDMTGRTPGLAASLFAAHPIAKVVLTDKRPQNGSGPELGQSWYWMGEVRNRHYINDPVPAHSVPDCLFDMLKRPASRSRLAFRNAEADAIDALSAACVALGRRRAGLPPL